MKIAFSKEYFNQVLELNSYEQQCKIKYKSRSKSKILWKIYQIFRWGRWIFDGANFDRWNVFFRCI